MKNIFPGRTVTESELQKLLPERSETIRKFIERRIPRRMQPVVAVDDVLQEIWITAFRSIGSFSSYGSDSLDRWLMTIARTRLLNAIRYASQSNRAVDRVQVQVDRTGSYFALFGRIAHPGRTPSSEHACDEAVRAVRVALDALPDDYRRAITMHHIDGRSQSEVATVMQKSTAAVNGLLYRGMLRLKDSMGWDGRFFSDTNLENPPAGDR